MQLNIDSQDLLQVLINSGLMDEHSAKSIVLDLIHNQIDSAPAPQPPRPPTPVHRRPPVRAKTEQQSTATESVVQSDPPPEEEEIRTPTRRVSGGARPDFSAFGGSGAVRPQRGSGA